MQRESGGIRALRSRTDLPATFMRSLVGSAGERELFQDVRAFCVFVGYPRSGHSLVGSLLNAHPEAVIANELDVFHLLRWGFTRRQLYRLILEHDRRWGESGRVWSGYSYFVPGQWQGRYRSIRVIGDKKGGGSTLKLRRRPHLIDRLRSAVEVPVRFIHVIRNPFDNITTMARRSGRPLVEAVDRYFAMVATVEEVRARIDNSELIDVRLEELIADPHGTLKRLCCFVGLQAEPGYVEACASIVFTSPRATRRSAEWGPELVERVQRRCADVPFLDGYRYMES